MHPLYSARDSLTHYSHLLDTRFPFNTSPRTQQPQSLHKAGLFLPYRALTLVIESYESYTHSQIYIN